MKSFFSITFALLFSVVAFSQGYETTSSYWDNQQTLNKRNEVKLDAAQLVWAHRFSVSYDRLLSDEFSIGIAAEKGSKYEYTQQWAVMPYMRWHFGDDFCQGLFLEFSGAIFQPPTEEDTTDRTFYLYNAKKEIAPPVYCGIGLGLGWKFVSKRNWVFEMYAGGGPSFDGEQGYARLGFSIGKRF